MKGKWNVDGTGHVPIPESLKSFFVAKRNEVLANLMTSMFMALAASLFAFGLERQAVSQLPQLALDAITWLLAGIPPAIVLTWFVT